MILITVDGAYPIYDASSDVVILVTVNGADVALQEAAVGISIPVVQHHRQQQQVA